MPTRPNWVLQLNWGKTITTDNGSITLNRITMRTATHTQIYYFYSAKGDGWMTSNAIAALKVSKAPFFQPTYSSFSGGSGRFVILWWTHLLGSTAIRCISIVVPISFPPDSRTPLWCGMTYIPMAAISPVRGCRGVSAVWVGRSVLYIHYGTNLFRSLPPHFCQDFKSRRRQICSLLSSWWMSFG